MSKHKHVTPEDVIKIYRKHGEEITLEQAEKILAFTTKFAKLALNQVFGKGDIKP